MAPAILTYLGLGGQTNTPPVQHKTPVRALPASWYTSKDVYELERRAIFSRKWMLITHQSRVSKYGDWIKFEITGYEFVVTRDRMDKINAFHNVCRHRAYPVLEGNTGNSKILSCKYHGWSYGLDGKLAKAPKYDELDNFDKSQNGLLKIHVRVDANGFIWVNLDGAKEPEIAWEDDFAAADMQERFKQYDFDDYVLDHEYTMQGSFNWKILADNSNECYHRPSTDPDVPGSATHDVDGKLGYVTRKSIPTETQEESGLSTSSTYYFPNVSLSVLPHFIMLQRFLPHSPTNSSIHYQIFRNKTSSDSDFQLISNTYTRITSEDKTLCEAAQKNLNTRISTKGELDPSLEKGPLYFQSATREVIREFYEREKKAGKEIWPARQRLEGGHAADVSIEDEELCEGLACGSGGKELEW